MAKLVVGTNLKSIYDKIYIIDCFVKSGGQGSVYKVSSNGEIYALKWYSKKDDSYVNHFKKLIQNGVPLTSSGNPDKRFVWPQDLIVDESGMGYIMDFIDMGKYLTLHKLTNSLYIKEEDKITANSLCKICINIAEAFNSLHSGGYCYKDISSNNIIFNIVTGDILIFDVDNVVVSGKEGEVKGTPKFMAPEIVLGKLPHPDRESDKFSLAAYFFYLLIGHHPFEGKLRDDYIDKNFAMDDNGFKTIYGSNAVFCFNPNDACNNLNNKDYQKIVERWNNIIPEKLKDKFLKTFVKGLPFEKRNERTTDGEWVKLFTEFKDNIIKCTCGKEYFPGLLKCTKCGKQLTAYSVKISIREKNISEVRKLELKTNTRIKGIRISKRLVEIQNLAEIVVNPKTGDMGLKNLSDLKWHYKDIEDKALQDVPNNSIVTLKRGRIISFIKNEVHITVI